MQHPQSNMSIRYGERVTLSVSANGAEHLSYKWKKDGEDITDPKCIGTDRPTLTIGEFIRDNQGKYSCVINNSHSSIESEPASLALGKCILYPFYLNMRETTHMRSEK